MGRYYITQDSFKPYRLRQPTSNGYWKSERQNSSRQRLRLFSNHFSWWRKDGTYKFGFNTLMGSLCWERKKFGKLAALISWLLHPLAYASAVYVQIYKEILKMPAWKQHNGADFVFFFPWSLNHVLEFEHERSGRSVIQDYLDLVCIKMSAALQITVENLQVIPCLLLCWSKWRP